MNSRKGFNFILPYVTVCRGGGSVYNAQSGSDPPPYTPVYPYNYPLSYWSNNLVSTNKFLFRGVKTTGILKSESCTNCTVRVQHNILLHLYCTLSFQDSAAAAAITKYRMPCVCGYRGFLKSYTCILMPC